jgi:glyoxylate reductase
MMDVPARHGPRLPGVIADLPLDDTIAEMLDGRVVLLPWQAFTNQAGTAAEGIYTYGHPQVDGAMLDRLTNLKVISNYGVGVDHIDLAAATARGIPVGNTPGVLEATTADLGFALLLASARRIVEGDRYARSPEFVRYDPGYMLGREVHGATLGIIGMGQIGLQVARRALGFEMTVRYHNRSRRADVEQALGPRVKFASKEELLGESDYVMLCLPLNDETCGLIGSAELTAMKQSATLINIARGPVVETDALTRALASKQIAAAALDVTDPEPLPRGHPLLTMPNVVITPHLGSATVETRRRMAELSVKNLLAGLEGRALPNEVQIGR